MLGFIPWLMGGKGNLSRPLTPNGLCKSGGGNKGCRILGTGGGTVPEAAEEHPEELLDAELEEWLLLLLHFEDPGDDST